MTSLSYPGGKNISIRQSGSNIESSTDNTTWTPLVFPVTVTNSNTSAGVLNVLFTTDLTLTATNQYFICGSEKIQIGSTSLKSDGSRPKITVSVDNYDGLIQNGTASSSGYSNIYVYNLVVDGTGYTTANGGGWIGWSYFGKNSTNNYIVNCASLGNIGNYSGCIVGSEACNGSGSLVIYGCSSSGSIALYGGGILGGFTTVAGSITCEQCWSTGAIGLLGGGIVGIGGGKFVGSSVTANKCYSTGSIGIEAGGIFGPDAGTATASNCYSRGNIAPDGGGIFGADAGINVNTTATNCYSAGTIATPGNGIYGLVIGTETNCYAANGTWSTSSANTNLTGTPVTPSNVGTTWISTVTDQPYELNNMGYTPYTLSIISANALVQALAASFTAGQSSSPAIVSGKSYSLLQISGGDASSYGTITVNPTTGVISTTSATVGGSYTLYLRNTGSYNITSFALTVLTNLSYPGGTTVSIRQSGSNIEFSTDNTTWTTLVFPVTVTNSNTSAGVLNVLFTTDLTLTATTQYFICGSEKIQIGSTSLKSDGSRPKITVSFDNYEGLIQNGTGGSSGYSNIYVYNLVVDGTGYNTANGGGWIGWSYFGKNSTNNYIVNCASFGGINIGGGGIVGSDACNGSGSLVIYGCSSSGSIALYGGGIVGRFTAVAGAITCEQCWSTGAIGQEGGGIFTSAGILSYGGGSVTANKCYSTGSIGIGAGGIFGSASFATASNCYSLGNIATGGGGIFGRFSGLNGNTTDTTATNCYSAGTIATPGNGIYGSDKVNGTETNCYAANGTWSTSSSNASLTGTPVSTPVGSVWISTGFNQPYELKNMGYTPYTLSIISANALVQASSASFTAGQSSSPAIVSGKSYSLLQISGGDASSYGTITVNPTTGVISTTSATVGGSYTLFLRNTGSYNITSFALTVENSACPNCPICFPAGTPVLTDQGEVSIEKLDVKIHTLRGKEIVAVVESIPLDRYLVCIEKDSLGQNLPSQRTIVSKDHKIFYHNRWMKADELEGMGVSKIPYDRRKLYNVLLKDYSWMAVNGIVVETLHPQHTLARIYSGNHSLCERTMLIHMLNRMEQLKTNRRNIMSRPIQKTHRRGIKN